MAYYILIKKVPLLPSHKKNGDLDLVLCDVWGLVNNWCRIIQNISIHLKECQNFRFQDITNLGIAQLMTKLNFEI
jgi:hypothetical protein